MSHRLSERLRRSDGSRAFERAALVAVALVATASTASASQITLTSAAGFPNGRTFDADVPANVIDGDITTWTWTTNPNNTVAPSYLAVGFGSTEVDRIRLWKSPAGGGGNNSKNLIIQYTTDAGPLDTRTYTTVADLVNGFNGTELWNGTVNANGTVTGDIHDSEILGWASLMFDAVTATGIRIGFSNPAPLFNFCNGATGDQTCNHYRVAEFEAYDEAAASQVPEPGTLSLMTIGGLLAIRSWRRKPKI